MFGAQQISRFRSHRIADATTNPARRLCTVICNADFEVSWMATNLYDTIGLIVGFYYSRCAKDIDTLIESLPNEDSSQELQVQSLRQLEMENKDTADRLEEVSTLQFEYVVCCWTQYNCDRCISIFRWSMKDRSFWRKYKRPLVILPRLNWICSIRQHNKIRTI